MTDSTDAFPDDIERLKAMLRAEQREKRQIASERDAAIAERDRMSAQNERLLHMLRQLRRNHFGRKSEKLDEDQLALGLEDLETAIASGEAGVEKTDATLAASRRTSRKVNRGNLPAHLPREEIVIEPQAKVCPCCGGDLHVIGEDRSERLDKIPAKYRVIVTRRPKYACRACERTGADDIAGIIQAPAPARLIEGGLPTEALVADVVVSKYAWHLPLYRQAQMMAAEGIVIDRSTLAHWVGFAACELMPLYTRLVAILKGSSKLFADETRCPVLDPGRGKTKTGYLWALARDDRPWGGSDPPAVAYLYAPGRGAEHATRHLAGFSGVLQSLPPRRRGLTAMSPTSSWRTRGASAARSCSRTVGATSAASSTTSPRAAMRRSRARRSSALPSSTGSRRRSGDRAPRRAARLGRRA